MGGAADPRTWNSSLLSPSLAMRIFRNGDQPRSAALSLLPPPSLSCLLMLLLLVLRDACFDARPRSRNGAVQTESLLFGPFLLHVFLAFDLAFFLVLFFLPCETKKSGGAGKDNGLGFSTRSVQTRGFQMGRRDGQCDWSIGAGEWLGVGKLCRLGVATSRRV